MPVGVGQVVPRALGTTRGALAARPPLHRPLAPRVLFDEAGVGVAGGGLPSPWWATRLRPLQLPHAAAPRGRPGAPEGRPRQGLRSLRGPEASRPRGT